MKRSNKLNTKHTCEVRHETVNCGIWQVQVRPTIRMEFLGEFSVPLFQAIPTYCINKQVNKYSGNRINMVYQLNCSYFVFHV